MEYAKIKVQALCNLTSCDHNKNSILENELSNVMGLAKGTLVVKQRLMPLGIGFLNVC